MWGIEFMITLRRPPRIKVLEALSSIADDRIKELEDQKVIVTSSDGSRTYHIRVVSVGGNSFKVCSTDNGTKYRGYVGYPIIALLMKKGVLPYDPELASYLKSVPWKALNEKYKKYSVVESIVKREYIPSNYIARMEEYVKDVLNRLSSLTFFYDENLCNSTK